MAVLVRRPPILSIPKPAGGGGPATPTLVQHFASPANPIGVGGPAGDNYTYTPTNAVGAGNCCVLKFSYPHGSTPTVTDNNGNTWPGSPTASADAGVGNYVAATFVLLNANAGRTQITIAFGASVLPVSITFSEYRNVATASAINGTVTAANQTFGGSTPITPGSFTPTLDNDANGGNLIDAYFALASTASGNPTNWLPSGSFILLDGDIAWVSNQGFPHASQYFVQPARGAISPGISPTGDTSNAYNCVAVALKAASAGTARPAGIYINRLVVMNDKMAGSPTWKLKCPALGNLRVLMLAATSAITDVTSITDNDTGSSWSLLQSPNTGASQIWYSPNRAAKNDLDVTLNISGTPFGGGGCVRFLDISDAAASPFDVNAGTSNIPASGLTVINDQPAITPTFAGSWLALAILGLGQGPATGFASGAPAGAGFDVTGYVGKTDFDLMTDADGVAHLYGSGTSALHWNWTITNIASNTAFSQAVIFKGA